MCQDGFNSISPVNDQVQPTMPQIGMISGCLGSMSSSLRQCKIPFSFQRRLKNPFVCFNSPCSSRSRVGLGALPSDKLLPRLQSRKDSTRARTSLHNKSSGEQQDEQKVSYKSRERRVLAAMVAAPVAIVTSYELFQRFIQGKERKALSTDSTKSA